ncbi:MAG: sigma-70 family RNA polymerase sigma factor [Armatimonadota bacterium]|nr:MAG: sigma-70 family RNA polymerase sigma factor [Armatimonadota bacterium]
MSGRPGTDAELVARARGGDLDAFDHLVMRHRSRLYALARHITGEFEGAQDVVQEAFVNAFRSLGALRDGERLGQWLNTIVRRESMRWRENGRRDARSVELDRIQAVIGGGWAMPAVLPDVISSIHEALSALSARDRRVMVLHYLEGYTCEEIAGKVGLSVGGVKRILHDSRRKVRRECRAMADAERKKGPRTLAKWMSGEVPHGKWDAPGRIESALGQSICLSVNKRAKSVQQIAAEIEAHEVYVAGMVHELAELDVLVSPRKGKHLLNFIAFDAEDWRKLVTRMREPAGQIARRLADAQDVLRTAYEKTPMSSEWSWEDVVWTVNCLIVANRGLPRLLRASKTLAPPERPGGFAYWLGGYEYVPDAPPMDAPGWYGGVRENSGVGHFGPSMEHRDYEWILEHPHRGREVLRALVDGPASEEKVLSHFSEQDRDDYRSTLAKLVGQDLVERADGQGYRLTFPVWREADSEVLTPVVEEVVRPLVKEVLLPTWPDLDELLDEMGYEHRRDQYEVWRDWVCGFTVGEALRFMVKQGTLPELDDSPPAKWNFAAWKGDLPLFSLAPD